MMIRALASLTLLSSFALPATAETTICKIDGELIGPETVSWSTDTQKAKLKLHGETLEGQMTWQRKHSDQGNAVNLTFKPKDPLFGDEFEFTVFPTDAGHRILGVAYKYHEGVRHLYFSQGNYAATCSSL